MPALAQGSQSQQPADAASASVAPVQHPVLTPQVRAPFANAQPPILCTNLTRPKMPLYEGTIDARYDVKVTVTDGKVRGMEILVVQPAADRKLSRALIGAMAEAVQTYDCPGSFTFIQSFHFQGNGPSVAAPKLQMQ